MREALTKAHDAFSENPQLRQLKELNKSNLEIQKELQEANVRVSSLENELQQIKNSHKHDFIKQVVISLISAVLGSAATLFIEWLIELLKQSVVQ